MNATAVNKTEMIVASIREEILRGDKRAGDPLRQDEIAAQFEISKIPVREALFQLKSEGLVTFVQNKGAAVSSLSAKEVDEIYTMRIALESVALERAFPNLTIANLNHAEALIHQINQEKNITEWGRLNWAFHATLYAPANLPRLIEMVETLHTNVARYLIIYLSELNFQEQSQEEHWQILNACRIGNLQEAKRIMEAHLRGASQKLITFFENNIQEKV